MKSYWRWMGGWLYYNLGKIIFIDSLDDWDFSSENSDTYTEMVSWLMALVLSSGDAAMKSTS